ncbi:MAG: hypothetical protein A2287_05125 [Candidatus Melainabacteria bacterium RIFOXYA12_FULL_32_12]|nr:MAG: hypothetical protein A2287_05125 [Candidatus Melainabacteria bacterium RIFOXYA12_FULL_32_12]
MVKILCHSVYQNAELFKIVPTKENIQDEFVLYLEKCVICEKPVLEIKRMDDMGNCLEPIRIRTKNIQKFLDSMSVIWKSKKVVPMNTPYSKFSLYYNEYGVKKKCHQNISNLQLGRIETDPYMDLKTYKEKKFGIAN